MNMPAPWRLAALALLVAAASAQAQSRSTTRSDDRARDRGNDDAEFKLDTTVAIGRTGTVDLQTFTGDIQDRLLGPR